MYGGKAEVIPSFSARIFTVTYRYSPHERDIFSNREISDSSRLICQTIKSIADKNE